MQSHKLHIPSISGAFVLGVAVIFSVLVSSCGNGKSERDETPDRTDTLRAVTLYGPTSFFIYRGDSIGYDYSLLEDLCEVKHWALKLEVAGSLKRAVEMLDSGIVDIIAYEVPITGYYKQLVLPCGPENYTTQVLVQPKVKGEPDITDVTQLVGKDVYVELDSKYQRRMENLNAELGGGINIIPIDTDTLLTEDLIQMVSDGRIPMTVIDSDVAKLNKTYFNDLDVSMNVSFPQRASWAVAPGNHSLADQINDWFESEVQTEANEELLRRYFEQSKSRQYTNYDFSKGYISQYDSYFKKYAPNIDWDWRLLAAQAYAESNFNPRARSWVGAKGLMQIMPRTGRGYGASVNSLGNPDVSVKVATRLLDDLDGYLKEYVPNDKERVKFVIGAYNVGIAHVYDAIRLAKKYNLDPQKWDDNVEKALLMKAKPKYYNDPVVKYGYCRGTETSAYVKRIMRFYDDAKKHIPA